MKRWTVRFVLFAGALFLAQWVAVQLYALIKVAREPRPATQRRRPMHV
jgi:hypothetical protein